MHTTERQGERERETKREKGRERVFVYFGLVWFVCMYALLVLCVIFFCFGNKRDRRYKRGDGVKGRKSKKDIKGLRVFFLQFQG